MMHAASFILRGIYSKHYIEGKSKVGAVVVERTENIIHVRLL